MCVHSHYAWRGIKDGFMVQGQFILFNLNSHYVETWNLLFKTISNLNNSKYKLFPYRHDISCKYCIWLENQISNMDCEEKITSWNTINGLLPCETYNTFSTTFIRVIYGMQIAHIYNFSRKFIFISALFLLNQIYWAIYE